MAVFTPNQDFVALSDLIARELARVKPFGLSKFERTFDYSRLLGVSVTFSAFGEDRVTSLEICYIKPDDARATDALSCTITRGSETIYISHYLAHMGLDSSFMSNSEHRPPEDFLVAAIQELGNLDRLADLSVPFVGGDIVEIPFDYGNAR